MRPAGLLLLLGAVVVKGGDAMHEMICADGTLRWVPDGMHNRPESPAPGARKTGV